MFFAAELRVIAYGSSLSPSTTRRSSLDMQSYGCISWGMLDVFAAVADPTRRSILERLRGEGSLSVSSLANVLPISRQAVTKHLDVLEKAGLIRKRVLGRERLHELEAAPLREVDDWLEPYAAAWDERLERLRTHLDGDGDGHGDKHGDGDRNGDADRDADDE